mmetsp:Transcript_7789/g.11780  ORF Transcript_7789/g.11780 Transcript_7789/m.11780 type:complete len:204 (+) Transcript_7789:1260-1871(+)
MKNSILRLLQLSLTLILVSLCHKVKVLKRNKLKLRLLCVINSPVKKTNFVDALTKSAPPFRQNLRRKRNACWLSLMLTNPCGNNNGTLKSKQSVSFSRNKQPSLNKTVKIWNKNESGCEKNVRLMINNVLLLSNNNPHFLPHNNPHFLVNNLIRMLQRWKLEVVVVINRVWVGVLIQMQPMQPTILVSMIQHKRRLSNHKQAM